MKKTKIPIANKVEKKTDEIIKKYIEDSGKLEFFFNYFVHYRNIKGSYPNLDNLREYLFTKILDAISNNKKIGFYFKDISNLDNSEKLKSDILNYQKNNIYIFDYGLQISQEYFFSRNIRIEENILRSSIEVIEDLCQEILSDKLNNQNHQDISFKEKIENNFSNTSLMELRCNVVFITFKNKLFEIWNRNNMDRNSIFSLDVALLLLGNSITFNSIEENIGYINNILDEEHENNYLYIKKNIIASKYEEIVEMMLNILDPLEKELLILRYGLNEKYRHTLIEICELRNQNNIEIVENLIRILWKLRLSWPNEILFRVLFGFTELEFDDLESY